MRYALINTVTKIVENCIEWEGADYKIPSGFLLVQTDQANIGSIFDGKTGTFSQESQPKEVFQE